MCSLALALVVFRGVTGAVVPGLNEVHRDVQSGAVLSKSGCVFKKRSLVLKNGVLLSKQLLKPIDWKKRKAGSRELIFFLAAKK